MSSRGPENTTLQTSPLGLEGKKHGKERFSPKKAFTFVMLGATAFTLAACTQQVSAEPRPEPSQNNVEVNNPAPKPSATETEKAPSAELEPLSAELSPEELALATIEMRSEWALSGATEADVKDSVEELLTVGNDEYINQRADKTAAKFTEMYLDKDWQSNPDLVEYRRAAYEENKIQLNSALVDYLDNVNNGKDNKFTEIESTVSNVTLEQEADEFDTQRIVSFNFHQGYINDNTLESNEGFATYTYNVQEDGTVRLAGATYDDDQHHEEFVQ